MTSAIASPLLALEKPGRIHEIVTPEGVAVRFTQARAGDRLGAFMIDFIIVIVAIVLLTLFIQLALIRLVVSDPGSGYGVGLALLMVFLLENFYFTFLEVRWRGTTIGKRRLGLRVIDAQGGPLRVSAVFTRNLTRNLEVWMPLQILMSPGDVISGAPAWAGLLATAWVFVFALLPLFNKRRLRVGDMLAGTIVVYAPRTALLPDLGRTSSSPSDTGEPLYRFTTEQLDIYGIYELQVLEDLLRDAGRTKRDAVSAVCDRIKKKIRWDRARWDVQPRRFLMEFYAAQRRRLEQKMLLGKRQEFKRGKRPPEA